MKKLLFALLVFTSLYAQEQQQVTVSTIFTEIRQDIKRARPLNYVRGFEEPAWQLDTFLKNQKAHGIRAQIQQLSQDDKDKLMKAIAALNEYWPYKRDYLALCVLAGSHIDTNINSAQTT